MAGESFHSHGRKYQIHTQRSSGDRRCVVASECIRNLSFSFANSRRVTSIQGQIECVTIGPSAGLAVVTPFITSDGAEVDAMEATP